MDADNRPGKYFGLSLFGHSHPPSDDHVDSGSFPMSHAFPDEESNCTVNFVQFEE